MAGFAALLALALAGCPDAPPHAVPGAGGQTPIASPSSLQALNLSDPIRPIVDAHPIHLTAARNEWTSFAVQVDGVFASHPLLLDVSPLTRPTGDAAIAPTSLRSYQILSMPVQVNPGYVRHTGLNSANRSIPRALLPAPMNNGRVDLTGLRDPTQPANPAAHPNGGTVLLWVDLHVPPYAPVGEYSGTCHLINAQGAAAGASLPISLTVYDFALPDARHLQMVGDVDWDRLGALYPEVFGDTITPSLINRADPRYRRTIALLDQMMLLADENRGSLVIPGLHPTIKWPTSGPPEIDWHEFDSLINPWMQGEGFPDAVPIRWWPLPQAASLDRYDVDSRMGYWAQAASHFDQLGWLNRSPVWLHASSADASEIAGLAQESGRVLQANPDVRVVLPLRDDQLTQTPLSANPALFARLVTAGAGLVSSAQAAPSAISPATRWHWLQTESPGLVPYAGAGGDERDVRAWAWLAFLRHADVIVWDHMLPAIESAEDPADPNALTWFYPGKWFGVDAPVQTIQLKWLRRAQQDYEYLWLAAQRGEVINALQMARLITKPVEIQAGQEADPVYSLVTGTSNPQAWDRAQELLAQTILLRKPGEAVDEGKQRALYIQTLQWAQPQERPQLLPQSARWTIEQPNSGDVQRAPGTWATLQFGLGIYNASDATPDRNQLQWSPPPPLSGWEMHPQPIEIPRLQTYHVLPATISARFNLDKITPDARKPIELSFVNGFTRMSYPMQFRLPVAVSERREGPISLDGQLTDWTDADAIQDGPLVLMTDRPDLQKQELRAAPGSEKIYSTWGADNFYLAFSLDGLSPEEHQAHNDVYYQSRRAWGEDLCEILVQPVYKDNSPGPVLHVVCKPNGADWVERRQSPQESTADWRTTEGAGIRYATTVSDDHWRGEIGIPWSLINAAGKDRPVFLRFNFAQHRHQNCESASWCGPVDFGRDEKLMGLLYLRTPRGE